MADHDYDDELDDEDEEESQDDSSTLKQLRRQLRQAKAEAKQHREAAEAGTAAQRKLALMEAGIDITKPNGKLFAKAYDGDLDVDLIKAAAVEYGVLEAEEDTTEETATHQRIANASQGSTAQPAFDPIRDLNPEDMTEAEFWAKADAAGITSNS